MGSSLFQTGFSAALLLTVGACALPSPAPSPAPVAPTDIIPERDIDAAMQALSGATVLETERYLPKESLAGCAGENLQTKQVPTGSPLSEALSQAQSYHDVAQGVGLIVLHDGKVIHETYNSPATVTSATATASMKKSVLGLLFGIAVEKGAIASVEDRIGDYLSEWDDDPRGDITIRELLTMSSGLAKSDFARLLLSSDINAVALETALADEPGEVFAYNNAASQLLGMIVDRQVRGHGYRDYREFLQREFWCPLGNSDANLWIDREGGSPRFYAGLHATLRDWARIGELIRNRGAANDRQIVPAGWIAEMTTPSPANPQYGYQIWLGSAATAQRQYSAGNPLTVRQSAPYQVDDVVFFDGFGGQRVYVVPSRGLTIARTGYTNLTYDDAIIVNLLLGAMPEG